MNRMAIAGAVVLGWSSAATALAADTDCLASASSTAVSATINGGLCDAVWHVVVKNCPSNFSSGTIESEIVHTVDGKQRPPELKTGTWTNENSPITLKETYNAPTDASACRISKTKVAMCTCFDVK